MASGSDDSVLKVWDLRNLSKAMSVQQHSYSITSITWSPKDERELSVSRTDDRESGLYGRRRIGD
jgi:ribosome assembly protein RRB1